MHSSRPSLLQARLWLLTVGFTFSFGALFAKTWQVYRVYTNPKLKKEVRPIYIVPYGTWYGIRPCCT